jgi:lipoate-protein ligase B
MAKMTPLHVYKLGIVEYTAAFKFQTELQEKRINGDIRDVLLLMEHPPTLTLAKGDDQKNIRVEHGVLKKKNISVFETDRGGSITFHGPGQLVGYPIMNLTDKGRDIHRYVRKLEEILIETLGQYDIESGRDPDHVGVWVKDNKIAAIGVRVRKWVTKHGFALNVNNDLSFFDLINPCGITDKGVTSLKRLVGHNVDMKAVSSVLIDNFSSVFNVSIDIKKEQDTAVLLG